jgi:hypothetical protein
MAVVSEPPVGTAAFPCACRRAVGHARQEVTISTIDSTALRAGETLCRRSLVRHGKPLARYEEDDSGRLARGTRAPRGAEPAAFPQLGLQRRPPRRRVRHVVTAGGDRRGRRGLC